MHSPSLLNFRNNTGVDEIRQDEIIEDLDLVGCQ